LFPQEVRVRSAIRPVQKGDWCPIDHDHFGGGGSEYCRRSDSLTTRVSTVQSWTTNIDPTGQASDAELIGSARLRAESRKTIVRARKEPHRQLPRASGPGRGPDSRPFFFFYIFPLLTMKSGGERGIRTLEGLLTLTPLAGERFRPLSHLSRIQIVIRARRKERFDSGHPAPRPSGALRASKSAVLPICRPLSHLSRIQIVIRARRKERFDSGHPAPRPPGALRASKSAVLPICRPLSHLSGIQISIAPRMSGTPHIRPAAHTTQAIGPGKA
jgi:hypothetical protein